MPETIEVLGTKVDQLMTGWEAFKTANEENLKKRDGLFDDKLARINEHLDKFEPLNKAVTEALAKAKADEEAKKAFQEQLDRIETKVNRPPAPGDDPAGAEDKKVREGFISWARFGLQRMQQDRKNVLIVNDDTGGGYLAPPEYVREIIKASIEVSAFRPYVRVVQTSHKSVQMPRRTGVFAAVWTGEIETRSETTGLAYGLEDVPAHEMTAEVYISMANLEDSVFDIEAELRMEFTEQFAVAEGAAVVSGTGTKKPEGFLTASGTGNVNSGAAANVTADGYIDLKHTVKTAYARNGIFALNRSTLGYTRKLKDGNGQYIWMPGLAMGKPNSIDGEPYFEAPDMPSQGAGLKPVAFGDWRRAYTMVDRIAMAVIRDDLTRASYGQVKFVARRRVGGQVTLAEALATMTCAA